MKLRVFLPALIAWAGLSAPAHAAWSVTGLGANGNAQNSGGTTATTGSVTIPANSLGILGGVARRSGAATLTVADSAGNNWTVIECTSVDGVATNTSFVAYFRYGGTGLTSGTIQATISSAWTGGAISASYATGHLISGTVEDSAGRGCPGTPNGNSTSPSVTSGAATAAGNLAFGVTVRFGTATGFSYTPNFGGGGTALGATGNGNVVEGTAWTTNPSAAAITNNPTMNSATWTQQIVQFFAEPDAAGVSGGLGLRGVGN